MFRNEFSDDSIFISYFIQLMGHTLVTFGWRKTNQPNYQSTQFSVLGNLQEGLLWPIHTFLHQSLKRYVMRERPQTRHKPVMDELEKTGVKQINDEPYNNIVLNVQIMRFHTNTTHRNWSRWRVAWSARDRERAWQPHRVQHRPEQAYIYDGHSQGRNFHQEETKNPHHFQWWRGCYQPLGCGSKYWKVHQPSSEHSHP